jgi:hypothetical protein
MSDINFDEMNPTNDVSQYDYDDFEEVEWPDEGEEKTVIGEILQIDHEVGKYDSSVYLLETTDGDQVLIWGNGSIDKAVGRIETLGIGDTLAIRHTGETYENKYGTFHSFDVRYQNADN